MGFLSRAFRFRCLKKRQLLDDSETVRETCAMKKQSATWVLGVSLVSLLSGLHSDAAHAGQRVEISIRAALVPPVGLDDNDAVPIVLHGVLPNNCFELAGAEARLNSDGRTYDLHQYAQLRSDELCMSGKPLPPEMAATVPFNNDEIKLPKLPQNTYGLRYWPNIRRTTQFQVRYFEVARARSSAPDERSYAVISKALTPMVVQAGPPVQLLLSGALNSGCVELERVQVDLVGDTFIVLPLTRVRAREVCTQQVRPFVVPVTLQPSNPGLYLVHVRSLSGQAVNSVFEALR